ncbi:hypothetical protein CXB49_13575 [Chromobacterium sp. ATCC 53434]|nr:hypothetical protein CXB49_13575 [Chromobacterium sp. ATCC 53434]
MRQQRLNRVRMFRQQSQQWQHHLPLAVPVGDLRDSWLVFAMTKMAIKFFMPVSALLAHLGRLVRLLTGQRQII